MTKIKLCGLANEDALRIAGEARPDAVGFVLASSPRRVDVPTLARLLDWVPDGVQRWAVFRTPDAQTLSEIAHLPLTGVQGSADWDGIGLPESWAFLPVFQDGADLEARVRAFGFDGRPRVSNGLIDALLVDGPVGGGMGVAADWPRVARVAQLGPLVLAGGLTPANVAEAVRVVRPYAVDVSSGVESAPARKDADKVRAFVAAVRGE